MSVKRNPECTNWKWNWPQRGEVLKRSSHLTPGPAHEPGIVLVLVLVLVLDSGLFGDDFCRRRALELFTPRPALNPLRLASGTGAIRRCRMVVHGQRERFLAPNHVHILEASAPHEPVFF